MIMKITVRVHPRAREEKMFQAGQHDHYEVYVKAPPLEGKANEAVEKLVAEHFEVPVRTVRVINGLKSKVKIIEILM